ncbi:MAG: fused MFS/spermidine synthase [Deltaproteobacteria bacterium]|nr:fused MFS/spermidine synthase [Deltaproteobacteria bacterium]
MRKATPEGTSPQPGGWREPTLLFLFLFSGATGLVYEVAWVRQFMQALGSSNYAVTLVLTAFMTGLGLGSLLLGGRADLLSGRGLARLYALVEAGIGLYALLLPTLLDWAERAYVACHLAWEPTGWLLSGLKLGLYFLLLVAPTTLMGATLPLLTRYLARSHEAISLNISRCYSANTLGAILGALVAGYYLLSHWGLAWTTRGAAALNLALAGAFWLLRFRQPPAAGPDSTPGISLPRRGERGTVAPAAFRRGEQWATLGALGFSGAAAMFYETAWTRTLSMVLGTTTYAFSTMLATFLIGIALGSAVYGKLRKSISPISLFSTAQLLVSFTVLLGIPLMEKLPFAYLSLYSRWGETWESLQVVRFFLASAVMIAPTLAMGVLLPAASAICIEETGHLGRRLGQVYALNTLGNVVGAVLAGMVLIPGLGLQNTIILGALLNLGAGLAPLWAGRAVWFRRWAGLAGAAAILSLLGMVVSPWSPLIMNSGVYVYAARYHKMLHRYQDATQHNADLPLLSAWEVWRLAMEQYHLLYYRNGPVASVAVMERPDGVRFLTIDGKTDASTGERNDMQTQVMMGQLPLLLSRGMEQVLVVGLGSGVTVGSVLTHPVGAVDCAEISPAVIDAAAYFAEANHHALADSRLHIIARDARDLLLTSDQLYDAIISQPSNPWIHGISRLFSLEWYRMVEARLKKGGVFAQWVPTYLMSERDLKIIINTVRTVFPNLSLWSSGSVGDVILLAVKGENTTRDGPRWQSLLSRREVRRDLERVGLAPSNLVRDLFLMEGGELEDYLVRGSAKALPTNTDNLLITEFSTPKLMARPGSLRTVVGLVRQGGGLAP